MQDTYTVRLGSKANNSDGELERIVTSKQKSHVAFIVGVVCKVDTINAEVMGDIVVNEFISALNESANTDHRIELRGFGVFSSKQVEQTFSRNPKTGEKVLTPARRQNHFKVSKTLRKRLKEARR
ncbi:hypothetical protein JCM19239_5357 [Vibrio variabilis]|uniref:Integration host factor beta subunit n=1 Tax=Vibrio variabilis TaxID=990271 RepID=A0ABQ0JCM5_9VIBR|nr:hypothetical protein JCM19239_5357 [Vibrio variabilis]